MRERSFRQNLWARTGLKAVGSAALEKYNREVRPYRALCGARCKKDGEPCRNLALAGAKRCRLHGGKTGKGDLYHVVQWPNGNAPNWQKKLHDKLKRIDRDRRRLEKRLAGMTVDQRDRYERWVKAHKPGPALGRVSRRADKKAAADFQITVEQPPKISPELAALRAEREALEAERDRVMAEIETHTNEGVFS